MKELSSRVERAYKPKKCPQCGYAPMGSILYGLVGISDDLEQKLDEGRVVLGGCCRTLDEPMWECSKCGLKIWKKGKNVFLL